MDNYHQQQHSKLSNRLISTNSPHDRVARGVDARVRRGRAVMKTGKMRKLSYFVGVTMKTKKAKKATRKKGGKTPHDKENTTRSINQSIYQSINRPINYPISSDKRIAAHNVIWHWHSTVQHRISVRPGKSCTARQHCTTQ